jgi:nucleotide sugar dehydrogenase
MLSLSNEEKIIRDLREGRTAIAVHGAGFIGTVTAFFYAQEGVRVVLYDIDKRKVDLYKSGKCDVINLENWSGFKLKEFIDNGTIVPTIELNDTVQCPIHFIAVPTEKGGDPYIGYIKKTISDIMTMDPVLMVIESTLAPSWINQLKLRQLPICVAVRRDWFSNPQCTLKTLPRPFCASTDKLTDFSHKVLGIVCDKLLRASSMEIVCLTKAIENALWHVQLVSVQELATAFDCDVDEVLALVATHPERKRWYPNMKIGGYCVELGSKYILESADRPENLSLFRDAVIKNNQTAKMIAKKIIDKYPGTIGILGLTYKNDLKVHTLTCSAVFIEEFIKVGRKVLLHDSFYTTEEVKKFGCIPMIYPQDLAQCDIIILTIDHKEYYRTPLHILKEHIKDEVLIIDNLGVWRRHEKYFKNYNQFGVKWNI